MSTQQQPGFVGYVFETLSYTEARAVVFASMTSVLRYGALVLVDDQRSGRKYLALVLDVSEHSIVPSIDAQRLQQLSKQVQSMGFQNAQKLLQLLFSPTQSLVQWHGVRELKLRILGEIVQTQQGRQGLALPSQPPRPMSLVLEPDPQLLQQLLGGGLGNRGLYLGSLAYNPAVGAYLDPVKLTMHAAVLGQTGSGKTETVKRLVAEYAWRKHFFSTSGGIVVFDVHGEYTGYPYHRRDQGIYPLLDAALYPSEFTPPTPAGAEEAASEPHAEGESEGRQGAAQAPWISRTRKTIVIPFDLASLSMRRASEINYAARIGAMIERIVNELAGEYGAAPRARGLVFGRHGIYLVEPGQGPAQITPREAAQIIRDEVFLFVAVPLPSALSIDYVVELAKTSSTAFPDEVENLASSIGLTEAGLVLEAKGLSDLTQVLAYNKGAAQRITDALRAAAEQSWRRYVEGDRKAKDPCDVLRDELKDIMGFVDCRALAGLAASVMALEALEEIPTLPEGNPRREALENVAAYLPASERHIAGTDPWEVLAWAYEYDNLLDKLIADLDKQLRSSLKAMLNESMRKEKERLEKEKFFNRLGTALGRAAAALSSMHHNTRSSVVRGLRRVGRHVSPWLDAGLLRLLVERVADGFTIVHLAPPSIGDTDPVVARLLEELYMDSVDRFQQDRTVLLVVEEAHNLAPAGEDKASKRTLLRIAREGRKWGLSLVLVSQRPGFIDPNVLSQTATLIALRITNPDDITGLRRGSESASQEFIERLPDLEQGQAVVAGIAVPERRIPLLVKVEKLEPPSQQGQAGQQQSQQREQGSL